MLRFPTGDCNSADFAAYVTGGQFMSDAGLLGV